MTKQDLINAATQRLVASSAANISMSDFIDALGQADTSALQRLRAAVLANRESEVGKILIREVLGPYNRARARVFAENIFAGEEVTIADLLRTYPDAGSP